MKYLLDTHIILWELNGDLRLSKKARDIIKDPNNQIYYSVISQWEVDIKSQKFNNFNFTGDRMAEYCERYGVRCLPLESRHVSELKNLQKKESIEHNDPFDRILLAQAKSEKMIFLTHDVKFKAYEEKYLELV